MLPKLFLGSSREAQEAGLIDALQAALNNGLNASISQIDIVPWHLSPWKNLSTAVATLIESLVDYSYAVFILSADDELSLRGKKHFAARDNVIFEFGLFLAHLGPERTFLVGPENPQNVVSISAYRRGGAPTTAPITERPLRILTDLGTVYREGKYTLDLTGSTMGITFEVEGVIRAIKDIEARTSGMDAASAKAELMERLQTASAEIVKSGRGDSYYSGQFFSRFRDIATLKAKVVDKSVQDSVKDLLLYLERVGDLCDIEQLAREQHHGKGIKEVWVFSDSPLEFRPGFSQQDAGFQALRATIIDNLRNGVRYVYFVGPDFKRDDIEYLVEMKDHDRARMLQNIHVIKVPAQAFSTYFTLHFGDGKGPTAIYMSSVMKDRRDLLIQVSDDLHVRRIYERISILKGETEHEESPRVTRFVLR